jgi:hypothetical protein
LVLLAGVPAPWFTAAESMHLENLPTQFGSCSLRYEATANRASLVLSGSVDPPGGFVLCLPAGLSAKVTADGQAISPDRDGSYVVPSTCRKVVLEELSTSM